MSRLFAAAGQKYQSFREGLGDALKATQPAIGELRQAPGPSHHSRLSPTG